MMTPAKKQEVTHTTTATNPQPQPAATPAPVAAAAPTPTPSKAETTLMKLTLALKQQRQIDVRPEMLSMDGKFLVLNIGKEWPAITIGTGGGITLPVIKSYPKAFEAALEGDKLLARQTERDAKKAAAAAPKPAAAPTTTATPAPAPAKQESTTSKKQKASEQIEKKLQEAVA